MKIILTQEVANLGSPGDVVEVKDGYGRNYLIPRGFAIRWSRGAERTVDTIKRARSARSARDHDHAEEIRTKLESEPVNLKVRAGESGRLFGAVTTAEIAGVLEQATGESVDRRTIVVGQPIKALGVHRVSVKLMDDVLATVSLNVVPS